MSSSFFSLQGKAPKKIHAILTQTLACFLPGRAKDLSAPLYTHLSLCVTNIVSIRRTATQVECKQREIEFIFFWDVTR